MTQEWRKEKWIIFRKLWAAIQNMDPKYDLVKDFTPFCAKVDFVMNNFDELKLILKKKIAKLEEVHCRQQSSSQPPLSQREGGMVERRPIHESSQKREREETSDEEERNNDNGRLVRRKGKKIMSTEPSLKNASQAFSRNQDH